MHPRPSALFAITLLASPLFGGVTLVDPDPSPGFDVVLYEFSDTLKIAGGTTSGWHGSDSVETEGDIVSFSYDTHGDSIENVEFRSVTYQIQDLARVSDPWHLDPGKSIVQQSHFDHHPAVHFSAGGSSLSGGVSIRASYAGLSHMWGSEMWGLSLPLGFSGMEIDPSPVALSEFLIAGLLSGEVVTIDISPAPYATPRGIAAPYWFDFQRLNVGAELWVSEGGLVAVPEPSLFGLTLIGLTAVLVRRRRKR